MKFQDAYRSSEHCPGLGSSFNRSEAAQIAGLQAAILVETILSRIARFNVAERPRIELVAGSEHQGA